IEVVGSLLSSRKTGNEVAELLNEIDQYLVSFGLKSPLKTRVILNDRPLFQDKNGPAALLVQIKNIWSKDKRSIIYLGANGKEAKLVTNPHVIAHERVHTFFKSSFSDDSFVVNNLNFNEAMADFLAAHIFDDPRIGWNTIL